jgi:hypothetical protein
MTKPSTSTSVHGKIDSIVTYEDTPSIAGAFTIHVGPNEVTFHCCEPALAQGFKALLAVYRPVVSI